MTKSKPKSKPKSERPPHSGVPAAADTELVEARQLAAQQEADAIKALQGEVLQGSSKFKRSYPLDTIVKALVVSGGMVYVAAKRLGCPPSTIYRAAKRSAKVAEAIEHERAYVLDLGETALKRAVINGEGWAVQFLLRTRGRDRGYSERLQVQDVNEAELDAEIDKRLAQLAHNRQAAATAEAGGADDSEHPPESPAASGG